MEVRNQMLNIGDNISRTAISETGNIKNKREELLKKKGTKIFQELKEINL